MPPQHSPIPEKEIELAFFKYLSQAIAILRFMLDLAPLLQSAEKVFPRPGQGMRKKSLVMGLIGKTIGFLGDENIIKEDHADLGAALINLADRTIDGVVDVLNETGAFEEEVD